MRTPLKRAALGALLLGGMWIWQDFFAPYFYREGFKLGSHAMTLTLLAAAVLVSVWNRGADERERAIEGRAWLGGGIAATLVAVGWALMKYAGHTLQDRTQISVGNLVWQAELVGIAFVGTYLVILLGLHYRMGGRHE